MTDDPHFARPITRRVLLRGMIATALSGVGAACAPASSSAPDRLIAVSSPQPAASPAAAAGGPITLAVARDLANGEQDPYFAHTSLMVHEPLIGLDDALAPASRLAERWSLSEDGLIWTFSVRRGVTFHDGTPFDADAAIRNIERFQQISPRPSPYTALNAPAAFGPVTELRKLDSHAFQMVYSTPYPLLEATMSNFFSAMFSPKSFAANGDFAGLPAATGPWKLAQWQRDQSLVLERNESYWGSGAKVSQIRFRVIPDPNTRVSALLAGEVDGIVELGAILPAQARQLQSRSDLVVGSDPISITQYLHFDCAKPPFDDVRVRRALVLALDRAAITRDLVQGFGDEGRSLLSPLSTRWFSPRGTPGYGPTQAAQLAGQALGGQRAEATFAFTGSPGQARPYKEIAEYMQAVMRPLGIDLRLQQLESAALTDAVNRGDWNLRFSQLGWANGDPDFIMGNFLYSQGGANTTSKGGYHNDEVDQLVLAGRKERDQGKRSAIYQRLQEIAAAEVPVVALYHERAPYVYRRALTDLRQRANFQPTLDTVRWT